MMWSGEQGAIEGIGNSRSKVSMIKERNWNVEGRLKKCRYISTWSKVRGKTGLQMNQLESQVRTTW